MVNNVVPITDDFVIKVREARARKHITIQQASKEIGVTREFLSYLENGKRKHLRKKQHQLITEWLQKNS